MNNKTTKNMGRTLLAGVLSLTLVGCGNPGREGCMGKIPSVKQIPVDQVFRSNSGYRVYFTNSSEKVIEVEFPKTDWSGASERTEVSIFKDLSVGTRGYAKSERYNLGYGQSYRSTEIHLSRDGKLNPGIEMIHRYKQNPLEFQMQEIK